MSATHLLAALVDARLACGDHGRGARAASSELEQLAETLRHAPGVRARRADRRRSGGTLVASHA